jgi:hypothetical protein
MPSTFGTIASGSLRLILIGSAAGRAVGPVTPRPSAVRPLATARRAESPRRIRPGVTGVPGITRAILGDSPRRVEEVKDK